MQARSGLAEHPFLEDMRPQDVERLRAMAREVEFEAEQIIFTEGSPNESFYLLLRGRVSLEVAGPGQTLRVGTLSAGEELGWSSLLERTKMFTARALDNVRALEFRGDLVLSACEEDHEFGYRVFRKVTDVVAERLRSTRMQLLDLYVPAGARKR